MVGGKVNASGRQVLKKKGEVGGGGGGGYRCVEKRDVARLRVGEVPFKWDSPETLSLLSGCREQMLGGMQTMETTFLKKRERERNGGHLNHILCSVAVVQWHIPLLGSRRAWNVRSPPLPPRFKDPSNPDFCSRFDILFYPKKFSLEASGSIFGDMANEECTHNTPPSTHHNSFEEKS